MRRVEAAVPAGAAASWLLSMTMTGNVADVADAAGRCCAAIAAGAETPKAADTPTKPAIPKLRKRRIRITNVTYPAHGSAPHPVGATLRRLPSRAPVLLTWRRAITEAKPTVDDPSCRPFGRHLRFLPYAASEFHLGVRGTADRLIFGLNPA